MWVRGLKPRCSARATHVLSAEPSLQPHRYWGSYSGLLQSREYSCPQSSLSSPAAYSFWCVPVSAIECGLFPFLQQCSVSCCYTRWFTIHARVLQSRTLFLKMFFFQAQIKCQGFFSFFLHNLSYVNGSLSSSGTKSIMYDYLAVRCPHEHLTSEFGGWKF